MNEIRVEPLGEWPESKRPINGTVALLRALQPDQKIVFPVGERRRNYVVNGILSVARFAGIKVETRIVGNEVWVRLKPQWPESKGGAA